MSNFPRHEFTPQEANHYRHLQVEEQFDVFGKERMEKSFGKEAQIQDVEAFTNAIRTLVEELPGPEQQHFGDLPLATYHTRRLQRDRARPLLLHWNPEGNHGFAPTDIDRALASVQDLKVDEKVILKLRNGLKPGKYEISEDLYID
jgi:hypothetical protein